MDEVEPPLIALNKWLAGALFIPLLPLIGIFTLRVIYGDACEASLLWCSEVPTFALQLATVIIVKSDELIKKKNASTQIKETASFYKNASYLLAFVLLFCFYSLCRDGTITDKLKDPHRPRIMWLTVILAVILSVKTLFFSLWHRKLAKGSRR